MKDKMNWILILVAVIVALGVMDRFDSCNKKETTVEFVKRDSTFEAKIDSLKEVIKKIDSALAENNKLINEKEVQIKNYYYNYERKRNKIIALPLDSSRVNKRKRWLDEYYLSKFREAGFNLPD